MPQPPQQKQSQEPQPPHPTMIVGWSWSWWNQFFHSRTKVNTNNRTDVFVLCGRLRIAYALLILIDRFILSYDFNDFFLTTKMPCQQYYRMEKTLPISQHSLLCTIAGMVRPTQSPYVYYTFFYGGVLNAILLLLGITPKLQLLLLHINMMAFQNHSALIWDGEDSMFTMWNFLFLFLPLHHVTIYDKFRNLFYYKSTGVVAPTELTNTTAETWPMWPFRLWQIEMCCIYIGAGYAKLSTDMWYSGNALYHIIHMNDFFGGPITPDFIFNRRGPLHILTWLSLIVECSCIIFIWPKYTRKAMLVAIILLHLGIEGAMNMHCFEWLAMIGWLFFLVEREETGFIKKTISTDKVEVNQTNGTEGQGTANAPSTNAAKMDAPVKSHWTRRVCINLFLVIVISTFVFDTTPFRELTKFIPSITDRSSEHYMSSLFLHRLEIFLLTMDTFRTNVAQPLYYIPFVHSIGLYQGVWDVFTDSKDHNVRVETIIHYRNDTFVNLISPDWSNMTWYTKKRWQRVMTFYENFAEVACLECYADYYAEKYGSKNVVIGVRIMLHKQHPPTEPAGNIFDMEYFYKPAKEVLESYEREEIFLLNYCVDAAHECEKFMKLGYCEIDNDDGNDQFLLLMTKNCRRSCQLCDVDADSLEIGNRVSVYHSLDEQYFDGTIIDSKMLHTVRQYLIQYDGYEDKPEWKSSIALRRLGVRLLTKGTEKSNKVGASSTRKADGETVPTLASSWRNSLVGSSDDIVDNHDQRRFSATVSESRVGEESHKDEF